MKQVNNIKLGIIGVGNIGGMLLYKDSIKVIEKIEKL